MKKIRTFVVCWFRHSWSWYLQDYRKTFELSLECEDCGRVVFGKVLYRKVY